MKVIFAFFASLLFGICLFFGGVMGFSYSLTTESAMPDAQEITFAETELTVNGYEWHLPLIGGKLDKQVVSASDLTVQKLGTVDTVQPQFTLPDWVNYGYITVTDESDVVVFEGNLEEYEAFSYPANGDYKVSAAFWHLPHSSYPEERIAIFEDSQLIGGFYINSGVETPAQPTGYYSYTFRFTLAATAILTLSSDSASVGSVVALQIDGMLGDNVPTVSTDLASVTALPFGSGYRVYLPVSYNTSSGAYPISVTIGDEVFETTLTVTAITHEKVVLEEAEYSGTDAENTEYRTDIWPLYEGEVTEKAWLSKWVCPLASYSITVDYGDAKYYDDALIGYSNSVIFAATEGDAVVAPAAGTVVYAGYLGLTGNTIVIDHGHGVRTYLYGLASIEASVGDVLIQNQTIATASETVTLDVKIANKSISPWALFKGQGGMFWQET